MKSVEEILKVFDDCGLLVHTVQLKDLGANFRDIEDDIAQAVENHKKDCHYYGPKRKWSIGHSTLPPFFFMMSGENANYRHLAILVEPPLVDWSRYIHISSIDMSTGYRVTETTTCLEPNKARELYKKTLAELQEKTDQNQNSEIATLGFSMKSFCGLLFKGEKKWFKENLGKIKNQLSNLKNEVEVIPVFTYEQNGRGTTLIHFCNIQI